jgi:hypothetical protein
MAWNISQLWNWRGVTGRGSYLGWGCALMVVKYNLDRALAALFAVGDWNWTRYWRPFDTSVLLLNVHQRSFAWALMALALPFIFAGVVLTVRRLRDLHWPLWLVALFFFPALNFVLFTLLVLTPTPASRPPESESMRSSRLTQALSLHNPAASACLAIALTVLLTVPLTALATLCLGRYGWGVFVALPFCLGMTAALLYSAAAPRSWRACANVALLAMLFCGLTLVAIAIEGVICVLMAAPLAIPLVLLGATAGYHLQHSRWNRPREAGRLYVMSWIALPIALIGESLDPSTPPLVAVTTTVEIVAPARTVWRNVVTFSELPPPTDLVFRSGIAYPVRARIFGHGVGAVRHCEFSTGPFVEPITDWDEPRRLAFDVTRQPHPMHELSPYRALDPPHLEGFFQSRRGQFLLTPLANGHTRLEGTTWYTQNLWPGRYWRIWSDYLVHRIHARVLEHIKAEAEAGVGS